MEDQGISQEELAKRLQTSPKYVSDLVNGRIYLTEEMVLRLSTLFGTSTKLWLNLNQQYIEKKLEINRRKRMDEELKFLDLVDYNYWMNLGVVLNTTDKYLQIEELQKYFKISSMQVLAEHDFLVQYKRVSSDISLESRVNAWFKQR